jgi:hypothetical protein
VCARRDRPPSSIARGAAFRSAIRQARAIRRGAAANETVRPPGARNTSPAPTNSHARRRNGSGDAEGRERSTTPPCDPLRAPFTMSSKNLARRRARRAPWRHLGGAEMSETKLRRFQKRNGPRRAPVALSCVPRN